MAGKTIPVEAFGKKILFVDEGHKGVNKQN